MRQVVFSTGGMALSMLLLVVALVRNEEADLGLTGGDTFDASLEVLYAGADRLVAVCPKDHPLARKRPSRGSRGERSVHVVGAVAGAQRGGW